MTKTHKNISARSQVSLRVPDTLLHDMDRVAEALDRDRSWVMIQAFQTYMEIEGAEILMEMGGITEIEDGRVTDFDNVIQKAKVIAEAARKSVSKKAV